MQSLKIACLVLFLVFCLVNFNHSTNIPTDATLSIIPLNRNLMTNAIISEELFIDKEFTQVTTRTYYRDSIIRINITVLPQSNSSVEIICSEFYAVDFSPALTNATLVPGESFSESYTFIKGVANGIAYGIRCTTDSNATVLWSYEVLFSAKPEGAGIDFPFIVSSLLLSSLVIAVVSKRKQKGKK